MPISIFFWTENHLQFDSQLCLVGKKKYPGRGITGFQVMIFVLLVPSHSFKLFLSVYFVTSLHMILTFFPLFLRLTDCFIYFSIFNKILGKFWLPVLIQKSESLMGIMWLANTKVGSLHLVHLLRTSYGFQELWSLFKDWKIWQTQMITL